MLPNKLDLNHAYILHSRPYRETSLLVDLFTREHGLVRAVARSARGGKSRYRGRLNLFCPLLLSWYGKSELVNLNHVEVQATDFQLEHQALLCGFYVNELLVRLMHVFDPHPELFDAYEQCLLGLMSGDCIQTVLRRFEIKLLAELGFALVWDVDASTELQITADGWYRYHHEHGFIQVYGESAQRAIKGEILLAIAADDWHNQESLDVAKRVLRQAIGNIIGPKPIKSRALFSRYVSESAST